jgi:hypothetical protein
MILASCGNDNYSILDERFSLSWTHHLWFFGIWWMGGEFASCGRVFSSSKSCGLLLGAFSIWGWVFFPIPAELFTSKSWPRFCWGMDPWVWSLWVDFLGYCVLHWLAVFTYDSGCVLYLVVHGDEWGTASRLPWWLVDSLWCCGFISCWLSFLSL